MDKYLYDLKNAVDSVSADSDLTDRAMARINKEKAGRGASDLNQAKTSVEDINLLAENLEMLEEYNGTVEEKIISASLDIIENRAKDAAYNESAVLVFPEDAFLCTEDKAEHFIGEVKKIAKENKVNILFPLLHLPNFKVDDGEDAMTFAEKFETAKYFSYLCSV